MVHDIRVKKGSDCGLDHSLLLAKFFIPSKPTNNNETTSDIQDCIANKKYNGDSLQDEIIVYMYSKRLRKKALLQQKGTNRNYWLSNWITNKELIATKGEIE